MKEIIKKVLDRHEGDQINLGSEAARDILAAEIFDALETANSYGLYLEEARKYNEW
jgi:hypothetical protein